MSTQDTVGAAHGRDFLGVPVLLVAAMGRSYGGASFLMAGRTGCSSVSFMA
ncbi:MAG: hypothetical protein M1488_05985 [Gammaproteobacteria bacterium]|nr:hypothetical protein [Gammaproteobacteria bacterium]